MLKDFTQDVGRVQKSCLMLQHLLIAAQEYGIFQQEQVGVLVFQ